MYMYYQYLVILFQVPLVLVHPLFPLPVAAQVAQRVQKTQRPGAEAAQLSRAHVGHLRSKT